VEVKEEIERREQTRPARAARVERLGEHVAHALECRLEPQLDQFARERVTRGITQDRREAFAGPRVVGIDFGKATAKPLLRIRNFAPGRRVRQGMTLDMTAGTGKPERPFIREMTVDRVPLHAGPLGDGADGGPRRADGRMQGDGGVDDPLTRLVLALGAPLQLVFAPCGSGVTIHVESLHTYV